MARNKKHRKGTGKKVYAVIVDGETEFWYFQMMKKHEDFPKIAIKPELPKKKKLKEQYESVIDNVNKGYDKVIWVLDFDTLIKEEREAKKGEPSKIQVFQEYRKRLRKFDHVYVLVNNPCLEFWHLLHFKKTSKFYPKCENVTSQLKKHLPNLKEYHV